MWIVNGEMPASCKKNLDQVLRMLTNQTELHRQQMADKQQQADALRRRLAELDDSLAELTPQRDLLLWGRRRPEAAPGARPGGERCEGARPAKANAAGLAKGSRSKSATKRST